MWDPATPERAGTPPPGPRARHRALIGHLAGVVALIGTVALLNVDSLTVLYVGWATLTVAYFALMIVLARDQDPFTRSQARAALNFHLSYGIYGAFFLVSVGLIVALVLVPIAAVMLALWLLCGPVAAWRARRGLGFRYPLSLRLLR